MRRRPRFDLFELALVSFFAGYVVWVAMKPDAFLHDIEGDARRLSEQYGRRSNSTWVEEWIIREFFNDRRGGFFLDVGAADYRQWSNTYFLETSLGWEGIAVEPQTHFEAGYREHRPRTKFRSFFASDHSNARAQLFVLERNTSVASSDREFTERSGPGAVATDVPTITLNDLLDAERVSKIDFLSMDVELSEPKALKGFDVNRFRPDLVCIEGHPETRQAILDYFHDHGYVLLGRYLRTDFINLYFAPRSP
jgi:FkbM family methyltransferase